MKLTEKCAGRGTADANLLPAGAIWEAPPFIGLPPVVARAPRETPIDAKIFWR